MLHCCHRLAAYSISLLFGAGQVAYGQFMRAFSTENSCPLLLLLPETTLMEALRQNQTGTLRAVKANQ